NLVCLGQDDISDAYYPFGRNNMLEVAFLGSHLLWFTSTQDISTLYDMVTVNAARCIGLKDFQLKVGAPANVVILNQPSVIEALRFHEAPAYTISHGKLVDANHYRPIAFG
ncbi:MAG: amidohydrolase family protein, partial [Lentisphaerota bacterium]